MRFPMAPVSYSSRKNRLIGVNFVLDPLTSQAGVPRAGVTRMSAGFSLLDETKFLTPCYEKS